MDQRVKKNSDEGLNETFSSYLNRFYETHLAPLDVQDALGTLGRRSLGLATAAMANPQDPTETGFSGINEPVLEHRRKQQALEQMREQEKQNLRNQPPIQSEEGFISQFYQQR